MEILTEIILLRELFSVTSVVEKQNLNHGGHRVPEKG
jgi:hypothetical protein